MIISSSESIAGKKIVKHIGLVTGNTVRARHIGKDIIASLRNIVGGEVHEYTKLMAEAREQALDRMKLQAERMGGNCVINVRFSTAMVMQNVAEIVAYGTAVIIE
ncbi:MAG: YbjQ family protein [Acidobacteria bacterium]|nr:YbjQ family protein [Acidobacteriota bacterium]